MNEPNNFLIELKGCETVDDLIETFAIYKGLYLEEPDKQKKIMEALNSEEFRQFIRRKRICNMRSFLNLLDLLFGCFDYFAWYKESTKENKR